MEIVQKYTIQIEHWIHLPPKNFLGQNEESEHWYTLGITPEDKNETDCIYFNVFIEKKIQNVSTSTIVFYAKTHSCFKVRNSYQLPTAQFYFQLIEMATQNFAHEFHHRTVNTNLHFSRIRKPVFDELRGYIDNAIQIWNGKARNHHLLSMPDWQEAFKSLPIIPEHKKWRKDSHTTLGQDISFKLLHGQRITDEEEQIFRSVLPFYNELNEKLQKLDYSPFDSKDLENFKNYINYALPFSGLVTNKLTILFTYRLVVNEWVLGVDAPITDVKYLKYPPLDVVKLKNKYNRCNSPNSTLFYSTESIDAALKEIRPPSNKLITVGLWKPKDPKIALNSFPISHSSAVEVQNESVLKAQNAHNEMAKKTHPLFWEFLNGFFKILGREYSKSTTHHLEFMTSATLSDQIFKGAENNEGDFKIGCIIYPSVGNGYLIQNTAILPSLIDKHFVLAGATEFEVDEPYYDKETARLPPDIITAAKVKNRRWAKYIQPDGKIIW